MSIYPENIIQQVLDKLDVVKLLELINYRTDTIQKRGDTVKCFCPIHQEVVFRTLLCNSKDKTFKCSYSLCPGNKGGDLISLYALARGIDYDIALEELVKQLELGVELPTTQEFIEKTIEVAENYIELGIYDEAERSFLKVLELQPNNLAARRGLIEIYTETHQEERLQEQIVALVDALLANQQFEECINYCLQLLEKNPDNLELREKLTAAYRGAGNMESFVGELMNLADIYIERGNYEGALRMYQQIEEAGVDIIDVHPHQVQVLVALGRTEEAINRTLAYAEKLIAKNEYEAALHAYREIIDLDDSRDDIREQYISVALKLPLTEERIVSCARVADELIRRGMLAAAATALEKLRERVPRNIFVLEKLSEIYAQQGLAEKVLSTQRQLIACLIERREFAHARQLINALLSSTPSNPEIYLLLAELNEAEENTEAATSAYKQAIELYRQQNKLEDALRIYDKLAEAYPDDLSIKEAQMHLYIEAGKNEAGFAKCMELINILEQRQDTTSLLKILNFALSLVPTATDLWLKVAELQRSAGNMAEAKSAFFKAHQLLVDSGNAAAAITQLQKILELDPEDVPAHRAMAVIQHSLGDDVLSLKHYKRAADLLFSRGELRECEEVLRQILSIAPDDLTALNRLAEVYESLQQTDALKEIWQKLIQIYNQRSAFGRVLEICQKFIELEPTSIFALENMATAYEQTQNLEAAIDCYFRLAHIYASKQEPEFQQLMLETILEKQPTQIRARQELVELLVETGKTEEAIKHITELTNQYKQAENYDAAAKFLLQLLERLPEDKRLHLLLLTVYEEAGKTKQFIAQAVLLIDILRRENLLDEVAGWYQRILQYEPDNINFRYNLIEVLQAQGRIAEATREYFALAEWYERQENYEEAINTYRQILGLVPEEETAYNALIRLYKEQADYENATRQICALAELYQRQHKFQPAIQILEQVFEYEPEQIDIHRKIIALALQANDTARALSQYARLYSIYYDRGDYEMAAAVQREAIQLSPAEPALREPLIKALISARKTDEAVAELFNLAGIYSDRQQYEKVLQTCAQILEHDPHNLRAHRLKAQTYLNLGDEKKALAEFIHLSAALESIPIVAGNSALSPTTTREMDMTPRLKVMKEYTFENFVVGEHNHFAYATALSVARAPAKNYNPLFIYADVGLGKTHLLHAIANYISENSPGLTLIYTNAEEFTTELVSAIQNNRVNEFRHKYSTVDVLLLDDVHFLAGKERAQEEFFHIFNTLFQAKKQIVVTSDRPPKDIPHLEKRLRSRFGAGVIVDIQSPEFETRLAILKKELEAHPDCKIPENIISLIAERVEWNVRELKGALNQVIAMKELRQEELSEEQVRQMLDSLFEKV